MRRIGTWRPPLWAVVLLMGCTLALGTGVGYVSGAPNRPGVCTETAAVCAEFDNFWEVWNLVEARFVDQEAVESDEMIAGAINGMLDSLGDQGHTRYLTAEQSQRFREGLTGEYEGIGAYLDEEGGVPIIVAPIEGSPAEAAGILPGDVILRVDGKSTEGMTVDELVSVVKGPQGTKVKLQVVHAGEEAPVEITITRGAITVPAVTWRMLPGKIAHVRLSQFAEGADKQLRTTLQDVRAQGARGLIMDVRDNPGGLVEQAVNITGMFVRKGDAVLIQDSRNGSKKTYRSAESKPLLDLPTVVLINGGSASSAEIFAGALQDYDRATLVGVPTAGTGTVLTTIGLDDGSELLLGIAQWQTPKGRYLRREGVSPDETLGLPAGVRPLTPTTAKNLSDAEILRTEDVQVLRALEILRKGPSATATPVTPAR